MARPIRIQYPGAVYHVMAPGNQGKRVFDDDGDRGLKVLGVSEEGLKELARERRRRWHWRGGCGGRRRHRCGG